MPGDIKTSYNNEIEYEDKNKIPIFNPTPFSRSTSIVSVVPSPVSVPLVYHPNIDVGWQDIHSYFQEEPNVSWISEIQENDNKTGSDSDNKDNDEETEFELNQHYKCKDFKFAEQLARGVFLGNYKMHERVLKLDVDLPEVVDHLYLYNRSLQAFPNTNGNYYITPAYAQTDCLTYEDYSDHDDHDDQDDQSLRGGGQQNKDIKPSFGLILERSRYDLLKFLTFPEMSVVGPENIHIRMDLAKDIVKGVGFMHLNHFAHCDLKPMNIFISKILNQSGNGYRYRASIADVGNCVVVLPENNNSINDSEVRTFTIPDVVTVDYRSPEIGCGILRWEPLKADIWSVGVILLRLLFNFVPFGNIYEPLQSEQIQKNLNDMNSDALNRYYNNIAMHNIFQDYWIPSDSNDGNDYNDEVIYKKGVGEICKELSQEKTEELRGAGRSFGPNSFFQRSLLSKEKYGHPTILERLINMMSPSMFKDLKRVYGSETLNDILNVIAKCLTFNVHERTGNILEILGMQFFQPKSEGKRGVRVGVEVEDKGRIGEVKDGSWLVDYVMKSSTRMVSWKEISLQIRAINLNQYQSFEDTENFLRGQLDKFGKFVTLPEWDAIKKLFYSILIKFYSRLNRLNQPRNSNSSSELSVNGDNGGHRINLPLTLENVNKTIFGVASLLLDLRFENTTDNLIFLINFVGSDYNLWEGFWIPIME